MTRRTRRTLSAALTLSSLALGGPLRAQSRALDDLRTIAVRHDSAALVTAVRQRPDDSRELIRRALVEASRADARPAERALAIAHRVAAAYASAWGDSFPLEQVARFSGRSAAWRTAKIAADSTRRAGNDALKSGGVRPAMSRWRSALRRADAIADSAGVAAALGNIGAGFYREGELDSAQRYLEQSRRVAESVGDRRTALNALGTLGSVAKDRGDLRGAQELYTRALEHRLRIGDAQGISADHNNLGLIAAAIGEMDAAREHYGQALAVARQHSLDEAAATALLNLGNVASVEADHPGAIALYRRALALYRSSGSEADAALVLHNLGLLELRRGSYSAAKARLVEALAIFSRTGTVEDIVQVRRDLASVSAAAGDLQGALAELRLAERARGRTPLRPELAAAVALARGDLAAHFNSYAEAGRQYSRAEILYRRAGRASGEAEARHGRAQILVEQQRYAAALQLLRAVSRTQEAAGDRRPAALTRLLIGQTQLRQGDSAGARRSLRLALDSLRILADVVGEAAASAALGDVELEAGAPIAAVAMYRRGLSLLGARPATPVSWQLHAGLGRALRASGSLGPAAAELRAAIAAVERTGGTLALEERRAMFFADKWDVYADLATVEWERGDAAAAFAASERMRSRQTLAFLARGRIAPPATADTALLDREQDLRRRVGELTQQLEVAEGVPGILRGRDFSGVGSSAVIREALARSQEEYAELLLELRDGGAPQAPIVRGDFLSWRDAARRLAPGEAILEYLVTDATTMVFVLTPDTLRIVDLGVGRHALEPLVDFVRGTLVRPRTSGAVAPAPSASRPALRRLHEYLLSPVEADGALAGIRRLIIVPHAELNYLPFAALLRPGGRDEYLIDHYDIGYAPSASVWGRLIERARSRGVESGAQRVLALAPRVRGLPGSREEVLAIGALYGDRATVLLDRAATEPAFRTAAPQYDILHLATYGVLNRHNPLFSFLELNVGGAADGRLEVHEVFGLALKARLVVLSACRTALAGGAVSDVPAGDDWVGLLRAFLGAGAEHVIATLWAVEDRSTARLMQQFYRRLRAGDSEVSALSSAQREMLRNPATADPFYWAGFVVVGGR